GCTKQEEPQTTPATQQTRQAQALSATLPLGPVPYKKTVVPIAWRTITGTNLALTDDSIGTITSPFPIKFDDPYGDTAGQTSVKVSMNGAISFTSTSISYVNTALPASTHATFVVPFWDDLFPGPTAADNVYWAVTGTAPNRELVIEWRNVHHRDTRTGTNTIRYQAVFFESSSDILFNYQDVTIGNASYNGGASATIGVQVSTSQAVQHSFNTNSVTDNSALLFSQITPSAAPVVTAPTFNAGGINEGDTLVVSTTFTDADGAGSGPWQLQVDTDYVAPTFNADLTQQATAEGPVSASVPVRASGTVSVAVRVVDVGLVRSAVQQASVTVADVVPVLAPITLSQPAAEGATVVLRTAFTDPGADSPWTVEWDLNYDGATFDVDATTAATAAGPVSRSQVFPNDGTYVVAARVKDKDGVTSDIQSLEVNVADLAPTLTGIAGTQQITEGGTLELQADFVNPGDNSKPWKVQWDFNYDGTFDVEEEEERNTDGRITFSRLSRDASQGTYALRIVDADGSMSQVQTLDVEILEASPVLGPLEPRVLSGLGREPSSIAFSLSAQSGAENAEADPITGYLWDFNGDGTFDYASTSPTALHTYRDNRRGGGAHMAKVRVMDEDGFTEAEVEVNIENVAPVLNAPATMNVEEGSMMALRLSAVDPGEDALSFGVTGGPAGLSVTQDGLVLWTPAFSQTSGGQGKPHTVTVTVTDDDGDSDSKEIVLSARWKDGDNDGMADTWEVANGLDPTHNDAQADRDNDGVSNMNEFLSANGGPKLPSDAVASGPATGANVKAAQVVLTANNVADQGDLTSVKYEFQVFSDATLATKVRETTVDQEAGATTSATIIGLGDPALADLADDATYSWRVRATDGAMHGAWSSVKSFTFNPTNDAPGAPRASQPMSGTQVSTEKPVLVVDNAMDVDDTNLTYTFELAENSALTQAKVTSAAVPGNPRGSTSWAVPSALKPFTTYYWKVIAKDADGATAESEVSSFTVYIGRPSNREPGMPAITASAQVTTLTPTIEVSAAVDADGDELKYLIEVDSNPSFGSASRQVSTELTAGQDGKVRFQTAALTENTRYYYRARTLDPYSASDWAVGTFVVNAQNDAPTAPVALNPSDAIIYNKKPTLIVQNGADPEGDAVSYSFEVKNADGEVVASGDNVAAGGTGQTSFKVSAELEEGEEYVWTARAKDAAGATSAASAEARFQVYKAPVIPQPAPDEGCSAGAGAAGGLLPLLAMAMGLLGRRRRNS
ncbi:MAG TPA: MYXO-CTERM sorting domain-containing protein, partial [Myxococcaceae bacterium]